MLGEAAPSEQRDFREAYFLIILFTRLRSNLPVNIVTLTCTYKHVSVVRCLHTGAGPAEVNSIQSSHLSTYEEYEEALDTPEDPTLPWPPLAPLVSKHYSAILKRACEEVEKSAEATTFELRGWMAKRQRAFDAMTCTPSEESRIPSLSSGSNSVSLSAEGADCSSSPFSLTPALCSSIQSEEERASEALLLSDPTVVSAASQSDRDLVERLQHMRLPFYMPAYPEPFLESKDPSLPEPRVFARVSILADQQLWLDAALQFLTEVQTTFMTS